MRYINDEEKDIYSYNKKERDLINEELMELGNRITEVDGRVDNTNQVVEGIITSDTCNKPNANHINTTTNKLKANESDLGDITSDNIINDHSLKTGSIDAQSGNIDSLEAGSGIFTSVATSTLEAQEAEFSETTTGSLQATNAEIDNLTVNGTLDINTATIDNYNIDAMEANTAEIGSIEADNASIGNASITYGDVDLLEADKATLDLLQTHNITFHNDPKNPFYIHIEPQDQPSETDYRIIEVPYVDTGDYYLSLRDPVSDQAWWSVIVHNNHSNITVSYSRRTKDFRGEPLTVPTLDEFYIYNYDSETPKLYIRTYVGGNLYWQNQSLKENTTPTMYSWYPFDISAQGSVRYQCMHTAATWFSHILNIGTRGESEGDASLFLVPTDWNNASRSQIEFNGERDIIYDYYVPNQSVNSTDEVVFKDLIIDPLDGKWVYNIENALQGIDPVIVVNGQLDSYENLIETKELAKWTGKVGTKGDSITTEAGCIYRDQAYAEINQYLYRKVALNTYDSVSYNGTPSTTTSKLVLRRKMNTERGLEDDLVVSAPAVVNPYEDADEIMWTSYTYSFYGEYPAGQMYTVWLEREVDGRTVTKVLESTVNSDEYIINCVSFKDTFTYGTIDLDKYTFNGYHKPITYLGDVVEGRWNGGEIHATKKNVDSHSSDYTGTDYDYTGNLTADGQTKLRDSVAIVNDYDPENIAPVSRVDVSAGTIAETFTNTDTIQGPSTKPYHEKDPDDPTDTTDWSLRLQENTIIGSEANPRDLYVTGNLRANIEMNVDPNKIIYKDAATTNLTVVDNSYIGTAAQYNALATKPADGSLVIRVGV